MSELGMVFHWRRSDHPSARRAMLINAVGAIATGATLAVVIVSKLTEGAWLTLLLIPALVLGLRRLQRHYQRLEREIASIGPLQLDRASAAPPIVIVPLQRLDRVSRQALAFAMDISPDIQAVQFLTESVDEQEDLTLCWPTLVEAPAQAAGKPKPKLLVIRSPYRQLVEPVIEHVHRVNVTHPGRYVAVLIAEAVERRWYHLLLHNHRATALKQMLLLRGGPRVVVIDAPWYHDEA
jgi:hypothetical protein